ncbi:hypothetical protein [Chitinophaga arvensicola]|uniref:Uncharacterized protein n=1 Tax=Chitinophaga arvensicola TaxID=29529 RepID=A0A1I0R914_9BACT|nr:hypothetical protein [Chitinophaga arvensicola]SEW37281.1 hypothetical protein SAMN04488122_2491 [Chitinophaga arvensicola]
MQFPDVINHRFRQVILTTCLVLGGIIAGQAQDALQADQNVHYKVSRDKYLANSSYLTRDQGTTVQQTYKAYQYFEAKAEARQQRRQWRQDRRMARNTWYDESFGYAPSSYSYNYPVYNNTYVTPFRWNDVAGITALALGAYMLFR